MPFMTCYQPHSADLGRRSPDVAHAVDNTDPNRSVAGELLYRDLSNDEWPGRGPVCRSCAEVLGPAYRPEVTPSSSATRRRQVAIVHAMNNDHRVTSEPYRLMPPRRRSDLAEALDAARMTGSELREALDTARGDTPPTPDGDDAVSWPTPGRRRQWPRRLGRVLARVDVWILLTGIAGVVIAYLTLMKP
jgi:hypothetical protein